jgi:hypothetical protein
MAPSSILSHPSSPPTPLHHIHYLSLSRCHAERVFAVAGLAPVESPAPMCADGRHGPALAGTP